MKIAHFYQRLLAKGIDFFMVILVCRNEHAFWVILSLVYLLIADGFFVGQSIGKRIVGIKTVYLEPHSKEYVPATFVQSGIRNCAFAAILFLSIIPLIGFVFIILGSILILMEVYFMYSDSERMRIGDIYAKTKVIQAKITS